MEAGSRTETAWTAKYELLCPLAAGGMAELHLVRAHDRAHGERLVVIKRLRRELAADHQFVKMFLDEARLASTLRHPNVVEVFEVGEDGEQCYIAMEHLHGHDLRDTMGRVTGRGQRLRFDQALAIARSVAVGLHYTHERTDAGGKPLNIVHRDVSPHNVFLTYGGTVKVVDFGVAKAATQLSRTRTGVLKGKVAYMSPEQATGQLLDRRSDVFCIGILLWEMTTGRWLYRKGTELDTLNAVAGERPPRPSRVVSDYPRELEKIVMKTLSRSRDERWATAGELADAIDELARRRKWSLETSVVGELVAREFSEEVAAWRVAQEGGTLLGDHLVAQRECAVVPASDDELESGIATAIGTPRPGERRGLRRLGAGERTVLRRWLWPALGAVAAAGIAAVWVVTAHHDAAPATIDPAMHAAPPLPSSAMPPPPSQPPSPSPSPPSSMSAPASGPVSQPSGHRTTPAVKPRSPVPSSAGSAAPPPVKPKRKPTLEELDKLP
ncbi:MAG TPA: serine/threonine-protein kinase [Kofleriaceae bacterium]|jgi:serine/threonine protein kinase|nr:serine/threonine-protein kinase [Kofleriaceae bacterium]